MWKKREQKDPYHMTEEDIATAAGVEEEEKERRFKRWGIIGDLIEMIFDLWDALT